MFTGIIEEIGEIKNIFNKGKSLELTVFAPVISKKIALGDSVAVNGICLTVTDFSKDIFKTDVSPSTFEITTLKFLKVHSKVNLELALTLSKPLGGHIVSGHVDGVSKILKKEQIDEFVKFTFDIPKGLRRYLIKKGSIAIDGISLTINDLTDDSFEIMIIPQTLENTTLILKNAGDLVNIETDIIGKYVENFVKIDENGKGRDKKDITVEFLREHGF